MHPHSFISKVIPLNQLVLDQDNVRQSSKNMATKDQAIAEIAASIRSIGLINPITVAPTDNGLYGVLAGGRRLAALHSLAEANDLPEAYLEGIPCQVVATPTSRTEISLSENVHREEMPAADQIEAWGKLVEQGLDTDQIANRFGVDEKLVLQRVALANVIPEVLQMLRDEEVSLGTVKAFTLASDHKEQREALNSCDGHIVEWKIREFFSSDTILANNRLVKFIGLDAYIKAGGTITHDLFDENQTIIHDKHILSDLLKGKLEGTRKEWLDKGWSWVMVETDDGFADFYSSHFSTHRCDRGNELEATTEEQTRLDEIETIFDNSDQDIDEELSDALEQEQEQIEAGIEARRTWPQDVIEKGGVIIKVSYDGGIDIDPGWVKRKKKPVDEKAVEPPKAIYSENLSHSLAKIRTRIVHTALLGKPELINDLLAFQLAFDAANKQSYVSYHRLGSIGIQSHYLDPDDADLPLGDRIIDHYNALEKTWLDPDEIEDQFVLFRTLTPAQKQDWINWAVTSSINVTLDPVVGNVRPTSIDPMIPELGIDWPGIWRPDDDYFSRLTKPNILEMMRPVLGDEWVDTHTSDKKGVLVKIVSDIVTGKAKSLTAEQQAAVSEWSPPGFAPVINADPQNVEEAEGKTEVEGDDEDKPGLSVTTTEINDHISIVQIGVNHQKEDDGPAEDIPAFLKEDA